MKLTGTFWVVLPWWSNDDQDIAEVLQNAMTGYSESNTRCFDLESVAQFQYREDIQDFVDDKGHMPVDKGDMPRIVKVKAEYSFTEVEPEKKGGIIC
jgi:hypothetical protein